MVLKSRPTLWIFSPAGYTPYRGVLCLGGNQEPTCFSTISPSKHKSPATIWKHLKPVLDNLQATHPEVSVIHVASAGPHTQLCSFGGIGRCWSSLEEDCIDRQHLSFNKSCQMLCHGRRHKSSGGIQRSYCNGTLSDMMKICIQELSLLQIRPTFQ